MTIRRSGSKNAMFPPMTRLRVKPNLMLISLVVRRAVQVGWFVGKVEAGFFGVGAEDSEFLVVIGRTALKARNCFTAAS